MIPLVLKLLIYLMASASGVFGLVFTNSFDNWVGNSTYRISWDMSASDPSTFDLALVQLNQTYSVGIVPNVSWSARWYRDYAIQIPRNGDRTILVPLDSTVWPGVYYWLMSSANEVDNSGQRDFSDIETTPTTITSFVPVTATGDVVQTSDGSVVTYRSSDVYSSAIIYTTIIVISDGGKGASLGKAPMIIGIVLALIFLVTLPIILWLVLRYRRRPARSSGKDKPTLIDLEEIPNSSVLNLAPSNLSVARSTITPAASTRSTTRQVWAIVDGEKRLVNIPQDLPPSMPVTEPNPFADPSTPTSPKSTRRAFITTNPSASDYDSPSNSINPFDPLLSRANTATTSFSAAFSGRDTSMNAHTDSTPSGGSGEKHEQAVQRLYHEHYALSEEDITSRIIVPGRAVDMGTLGREHVPEVDENGLLPPDYFQATQATPSRRSSQAGPSNR
ncbi:hypothetical protein BN14_03500 [Rhizoctonia solani AG-1 IB]|uniref:Uncharacterized protein n=1 Tax=Thanatephorus cucumeris (strain AG1-IB / isolate 7/3/14) TaxID=1108050 RepID=M5C0T3_THACB|nr:hypothetical protein BN14_03500 [Rhizoctonia solani AG-1 IB]